MDFDPNKIIAGNSILVWKATELFIRHFFAVGWTLRHGLAFFVIYQSCPGEYVPLHICTNVLTYLWHQGEGRLSEGCFLLFHPILLLYVSLGECQ